LEASNAGRLPELIPIRIGRMLQSPFAFMRGSSALMAHDLSLLPHSGIQVWACGDCHLLNFGLFATAERNLIFDLNDFDEAHPAPWEWDVKRLATSFVLAGRDNNHSKADCRKAARRSVRSYRQHLREYVKASPLEVWYARFDAQHYADYCGWSLARAHARGGDAATISGYLGRGDEADRAIEAFAMAYADQMERDHASLKAAVDAGRIEALIEEDR
jgi:uncharacterized protein (DUF2252 family)